MEAVLYRAACHRSNPGSGFLERLPRYVLRWLLIALVGVLVILTAEFVLLRVLPDDPALLAVPRAPFEAPSELSDEYDEVVNTLDQPLYVQYKEFIATC